MPSIQRIALILPSRAVFGLRILRGVSTYARSAKSWLIHTVPMESDVLSTLKQWQPTGIIAFLGTPKMHRLFSAMDQPVVNVSNAVKHSKLPCVVSDDKVAGQMAAKHLLERGFRNFAFCGNQSTVYAQQRCAGFKEAIKEHALNYDEYEGSFAGESSDVFGDWTSMEIDQAIGHWLTTLPKPLGLFACQDYIGFNLIEVCRQFEIDSPQQVALVGVDDDEMVCQSARPPLSSVRPDMEQIGFEAARLLDQMMAEEPQKPVGRASRPSKEQRQSPPKPVGRASRPPSQLGGKTVKRALIKPMGVIARQSTDVAATDDPYLAKALGFIRENADEPIKVKDILDVVPISRRALEQRTKELLGHSPLDEIHRVHIERAIGLLKETDMSIEQVACAAGFSSLSRMDVVFRRKLARLPSSFRKQSDNQ